MTDPSTLATVIADRVASVAAIKEYMLNLCILLAEARAKFDHDKEFHAWLLKEKLFDDLAEADAGVRMGTQPALLKRVLETTGHRSLRDIYREFVRTHP